MTVRPRRSARRIRSILALVLLTSLLWWPLAPASADPSSDDSLPTTAPLADSAPLPLIGEPPLARSAGAPAGQTTDGGGGTSFLSADPYAQQQLADQATLETRRPEVQWSPASSTDWSGVPTRQTVSSGDRVRTGTGASARLTYFEGSVTDIGPETGLLVQRLERTANGNIVTNLFQSVGTTVNRVVQLVDPSGGFSIETPAATAFVRGTMPRVEVARDGVTRFSNIPDDTNGLVDVVSKDPNQSQVTLPPGTFTDVTPGLAPTTPASLTTLPAAETLDGGAASANNLIQQRQQQRQQQQQLAQQQLAQSQAALASGLAASDQFAAQEQALIQQINGLLLATPTSTPTTKPAASATASATPRPGGPTPTLVPPGTNTATPLPLPTLAAGQLRIVLTWGATPRDLDSHLWVPTGGTTPGAAVPSGGAARLLSRHDGPGPRFAFGSVLGQATGIVTPTVTTTPTRTPTPGPAFTEVFFANRGSATSPPFATLDIDVTSGFGPETITIERLLPGQYTYAVHNFSNEAPLSASGAQVQVLSPTGAVATFSVPAGSGRWWTVFTLDGSTGTITPVNTITSSPPLPSAIGP